MSKDEAADGITFSEFEWPDGCDVDHGSGTLGPAELKWLGREYYDSMLREPVPERLLALLDQGLARSTFH